MLLLLLSCTDPAPPVVQGPLPHDAYLWQQVWTPAVEQAAAQHEFRSLWVLGGTLAWTPEPQFHAVSVASVAVGSPVVLRVEAPPSGVDPVPAIAQALSSLTQTHPNAPAIQLDMDLPTRRLGDYAEWLEHLRVPGQPPLSITALPTWLDSPDFPALAQASPGFVLQVHWLDPDHPTRLLSPDAQTAIHKAAEPGVPFVVALPAYGYDLVLDAQGELVHAAGEQGSNVPEGGHTQRLMADPALVAELIAQVESAHPPELQGWIWFRLPTAQDQLSWPPETLAAVREGRVPQPHPVVHRSESEPGVWSFALENTGEATLPLPELTWETPVAFWDALGDYHRAGPTLSPHPRADGLAPGQTQTVAWARSPLPPSLTLPGADHAP